jgi:hypothetical protein
MAVLLLHQLQGGRLHMVRIRIHIVSATGRQIPIHPITTAEAGRRAAQPSYSVLAMVY